MSATLENGFFLKDPLNGYLLGTLIEAGRGKVPIFTKEKVKKFPLGNQYAVSFHTRSEAEAELDHLRKTAASGTCNGLQVVFEKPDRGTGEDRRHEEHERRCEKWEAAEGDDRESLPGRAPAE